MRNSGNKCPYFLEYNGAVGDHFHHGGPISQWNFVPPLKNVVATKTAMGKRLLSRNKG